MAKLLAQTCKQCGHKPEAWVNACPQCASVFESPERVRRMGWMASIAGGLLVAMMAVVAVTVGPVITSPPTVPGATPLEPAFVGRLFFAMGLIGLLGIVAIVSGAWQVRHGTRNRTLVGAMLLLLLAFFGAMASVMMSV